jgi:hypothetical protein
VVEQRGIDVAVALFTPDGKKIGEVDGEGTAGPEIFSAIAETNGPYGIEVRSIEKTAQTGRYEIKVEALRDATTAIIRRTRNPEPSFSFHTRDAAA